MFESLSDRGYDILALHHAEAILTLDISEAVAEVSNVLEGASLSREEIVSGGGGEGPLTQRLRRSFDAHGWTKHSFEITKVVDGVTQASTSHEVDHVKQFSKGTCALEIEWNNKDPFFDRDLENFKRLHAEGAISVGIIVTRGRSLQEGMRATIEQFARDARVESLEGLERFRYEPTRRQRRLIAHSIDRQGSFAEGWASAFVSDKFGEATTHWRKLEDRVRRGVGNPCPLLLLGLPLSIISV